MYGCGHRQLPSNTIGHKLKSSMGAYVFRCSSSKEELTARNSDFRPTPNSGLKLDIALRPRSTT